MPFHLAIVMFLATGTDAMAAGADRRDDAARSNPSVEVRRHPLPVESAAADSITALRRALPERARRN